MRRLTNSCVVIATLLIGATSISADNTDIPSLGDDARRFAWLFLDTIQGDYDVSPYAAPSGGIRLMDAPHVHGSISRRGTRCPALLYITLDDPLRSEYETIIDTWNAGTIIPTGSVVFYESLRDEKTDSFWLRETVYSLEQLRIQSVQFNAGQLNDLSESQPSRPKSLSGSLMNITLQFEKLEGQSTPVSGTWPETAFSIDGLSLTKRADKSCAANW